MLIRTVGYFQFIFVPCSARYRPLWEILKVSDDKVTHRFHQKDAFGLNGEVSFTRKGR